MNVHTVATIVGLTPWGVRHLHRAGKTLMKIAAELTERRVPTKTGKSASWSHQAVARILNRNA